MGNFVRALGLMSGTSADGIDAALIQTDGETVKLRGSWMTIPYAPGMRERILEAMKGKGDILHLEQELTLLHAEAVKTLLDKANLKPIDVSVIGFHGQTLCHRPEEALTWQIGNGALLAEKTGINVVSDFRRRDVAAGGEGAPLVPLYHAALGHKMDLPIAVLNIGGIANVTWIGKSEAATRSLMAHDILAFDTGPGNVLIDEWASATHGLDYDEEGKLALAGAIDNKTLETYLEHSYFSKHPPKSLDRHAFSIESVHHLSSEDGAATLTAFTAESIAGAARHFPAPPKQWLVAGGGRLNPAIMEQLKLRIEQPVHKVEEVGWEGDALEAQAFAFLAVRTVHGLPLSLPTTTGARHTVTGGALYKA